MRRLRRWRAAAAALAAGLAAAALVPPAGNAAAQEAPAGSEAFTQLASCLTDAKRLLVLVLVDTSGSLQETDPGAQRVVGARVALSGLVTLSRSSGVDVEVQLAGFSVGYEPVGSWTHLTPESVSEVDRAVDGFARRDTGIDTDYFAALRGAHEQLEERAAAVAAGGAAAPCKAVLWFTDGQYDIVDRLSPEARQTGVTKDYAPELRLDEPGAGERLAALGRERLCGAGGLVDELRRAGTGLFFIALTTQVEPAALDFFDALTTGTGGTVRCGEEGSLRSGARLDVADLGDLLAAFDRAASEIGRGVRVPGPDETPVCPTAGCPAGRRTFSLDDTIRRFHLLAVLDAAGVVLEVQGPAGPPLRIEPGASGEGAIGDVAVRWQWASPTAVTVDAERPGTGGGWDGDWSVTFLHPDGRGDLVARTQVYLFSGLVPTLLEPSVLETGVPARLRVGVVSEVDDRPVAGVPDATLELSVRDPATDVAVPVEVGPPGPDGIFTASHEVPADAEAGERLLTLRLVARTRKGVALAPAERAVRLPVRVVAYPRITLADDRLADVKGDGTTRATVVVRADRRSAACAWLAGGEARAPDDAGDIAFAAEPAAGGPGDCLAVPAGAERRITVTLDPERTAGGTVRGTLRLAATADLNPEPRDVVLEYRFKMVRPVDAGLRLAVFLALLAVGVLLPPAVGWSVHRWHRARAAAGGTALSFPRWAWSRSVGRAGRAVGGWFLTAGRLGRTRLGRPLGGFLRGLGGRFGGWTRTRLVGRPGDDAPWSVGGFLRRRGRRRAEPPAPATGGRSEWGEALEGDAEPRDRIHISVLLDRSESMLPLVRHVVDGCNTFLAVHRAEPGPARLTLAQFDLQDPLEILLDGVDLAGAPDLTARQFRPRGVTPLYDSIGALLERTEQEAVERATAGLPPEDQLVVVLTDGRDNASSRYTRTSLADRVRTLEARGWTFVFLGANQEAYAEGSGIGIAPGSMARFAATDTGVRKAWASISRATLVHRRKRSADRVADRLDFFRDVHDAEEPHRPSRPSRQVRR